MILSQSLLSGSALPTFSLSFSLADEESEMRFSEDLVSFCGWFDEIKSLFPQFGFDEVYIGGSSARELLDHVLYGAPLLLRDLDIYLIANGHVVENDVSQIALAVEGRGLAFRGKERLRAKLRANPKLPVPECYSYAAGLGVHMYAVNRPILSLGVFKSKCDLDLNGLFNIDSLFLHLNCVEPSLDYCSKVLGLGADLDQLASEGLTRDPHRGYAAWRSGTLKVVNWCEVERCFPRHALRIVRTFSKAKRFEIDSENLKNFRDISSVGDEIDNGREFFRGLFKVLAGKNWASEMYMLGQLEVLRVVSRSLNSFLSSRSAKEISNIASQESSPVERAKALILASGAQDCWTLLDNLVDVASSVGKVAVT